MILRKIIIFIALLAFLWGAGFVHAQGLPDPSTVSSYNLSLKDGQIDCFALTGKDKSICDQIINEYYSSLKNLKGMIEGSLLNIEGVRVWIQRLSAIEKSIESNKAEVYILPVTEKHLDIVNSDVVNYKQVLNGILGSADSGGSGIISGGSGVIGGSGAMVDNDGTISYPNPLGTNSMIELIARILRFVYAIAIPLAVMMIIYSGILFLTAGGNETQVTKARKTIIWVVVGIAIILIGRGVITLIKDILGIL